MALWESKKKRMLLSWRNAAYVACAVSVGTVSFGLSSQSNGVEDSTYSATTEKLKRAARPEIKLEGTYTQSRLPSDGQIEGREDDPEGIALRNNIQTAVTKILDVQRSFGGGRDRSDEGKYQSSPQRMPRSRSDTSSSWRDFLSFENIITPTQQNLFVGISVLASGLLALFSMGARRVRADASRGNGPTYKDNGLPLAKGPFGRWLEERVRRASQPKPRAPIYHQSKADKKRMRAERAREAAAVLPSTLAPASNAAPAIEQQALAILAPANERTYDAKAAAARTYFSNLKKLQTKGLIIDRIPFTGTIEVLERRTSTTEPLLRINPATGVIKVMSNNPMAVEWLVDYLSNIKIYDNSQNVPAINIQGLESAEENSAVVNTADSIVNATLNAKKSLEINGQLVSPEALAKHLAYTQATVVEIIGEHYGLATPTTGATSVQEPNIHSQASAVRILTEDYASIAANDAIAARAAAAAQQRKAELAVRFAAEAQRRTDAETQAIYKAVENTTTLVSANLLRGEFKRAREASQRVVSANDALSLTEMRSTIAAMARLVPAAYADNAIQAGMDARYVINKLIQDKANTGNAEVVASLLVGLENQLGAIAKADHEVVGDFASYIERTAKKARKAFGDVFAATYAVHQQSVARIQDVPVAAAHPETVIDPVEFANNARKWAHKNIDLTTYSVTNGDKEGSIRIRETESWKLVMGLSADEIVLYTREDKTQQADEVPTEWIDLTLKGVTDLYGEATITVRADLRIRMEARAEALNLQGITFEEATGKLKEPAVEAAVMANNPQAERPAQSAQILAFARKRVGPTLTPGGGGQSVAA